MTNAKSVLNGFCQSKKLPNPKFETRGTGTPEDPLFISDVTIAGELVATGQGRSKREAETVAAELALEQLRGKHGEQESGRRKRRRKPKQNKTADRQSETAVGPTAQARAKAFYPQILAEALRIADARLPASVKGRDVREELARYAAELYAAVLENVGVEEEAL